MYCLRCTFTMHAKTFSLRTLISKLFSIWTLKYYANVIVINLTPFVYPNADTKVMLNNTWCVIDIRLAVHQCLSKQYVLKHLGIFSIFMLVCTIINFTNENRVVMTIILLLTSDQLIQVQYFFWKYFAFNTVSCDSFSWFRQKLTLEWYCDSLL